MASTRRLAHFRSVEFIMVNIVGLIQTPGPVPDADSIERLFKDGQAFHRQNQLDQAMAAYEQVLGLMPGHAGALHHVGIVAFQGGNFHIAAGFMRSAIAAAPTLPAPHCDLGNAYKELGQNEAAVQAYGEALSLDNNYLDAYFNRAIALYDMQRYEEALRDYQEIAARHPADPAVLNNIGMILHRLGRDEQALASLEQALSIDGNDLLAHGNRCDVLEALQRSDAALAACRDMITLAPQMGVGYVKLVSLQLRLGRMEEALADANAAIAAAPNEPDCHFVRGLALHALARFPAAVDSYDNVLRLNPGAAVAYDRRGLAQTAQRQFAAALNSHERAIELDRGLVEAHLHRAEVLCQLGRLDAAAQGYAAALELAPDSAAACSGRAAVFSMLGQDEAALDACEQALARDQAHAPAYWIRGQLHLRHGRFEQGWQDLEWRAQLGRAPAAARTFDAPRWQGAESLEGKTILLHAESDDVATLHACRYVSLVAARGATVIVEAPHALAGLLGSLEGVGRVVVAGEPLPAFDFECPLPSLPLAFDTTLSTVPSAPRYLGADPDKVAHWAGVLGERTKLRVGIAWATPSADADNSQRSVRLAEFGKLFASDCQFVVLQTEISAIDRAVLGMKKNVFQPGARVVDYGDTAALCELMDVIISVDGSIAHLAGALGKPVWVLLPAAADWRWLRERTDSPWYPSATLYRQSLEGGWGAVLEKAVADLGKLIAN